MKKVGINIDGVVRDFYSQFDKQYRKVFVHNPALVATNEETHTFREYTEEEEKSMDEKIRDKERELITLPVNSFELLNHYKFNSQTIEMSKFIEMDNKDGINYAPIEYSPKQNLEKFMYEDYPFQIFGMADEYPGTMDAVNKIQSIGIQNNSFEVILLSTHKGKAVSATYSFLGKANCRIKNIKFLGSDVEKWDMCDVIIDIMPETFQTKPKGKTSIKINHLINQWDSADYSFDSIKGLANENFFNRVFSDNV